MKPRKQGFNGTTWRVLAVYSGAWSREALCLLPKKSKGWDAGAGLCLGMAHPLRLCWGRGYFNTYNGPDILQRFPLAHLKGTTGERPLSMEWVWIANIPWKQHTRKRVSVKHPQSSRGPKADSMSGPFLSSPPLPQPACLALTLEESEAAWCTKEAEVPPAKWRGKQVPTSHCMWMAGNWPELRAGRNFKWSWKRWWFCWPSNSTEPVWEMLSD